jgi:hypothetical protein
VNKAEGFGHRVPETGWLVLCSFCPSLSTTAKVQRHSPLCHPDRSVPGFPATQRWTWPCAAFCKESRMKFANANNLDKKSGVAQRRDLQFHCPAQRKCRGQISGFRFATHKLQIPPLRCAPVGTTKWRVALHLGSGGGGGQSQPTRVPTPTRTAHLRSRSITNQKASMLRNSLSRAGEGQLQCLIPGAIKLARDRRVRNEDVKAVERSRNKVELCRHPG